MPRKKLPFSLDPLDPKFVPAKPKHSIEESKVLELERAGNLIITRKRDGYRHLAAVTSRGVRIYTRGIEEVTDNYPEITQEIFQRLAISPRGTLLDGEMIIDEGGKDNFERLAQVAKSNPERARKLQESAPVRFMIFDVLVHGGELVTDLNYRTRLFMLRQMFPQRAPEHISLLEVLDCPFAEATKLVRKENWEGLVLYDATKTTEFRLDGKKDQPKRPEGCWKWKPLKEDDFIAKSFAYGSGKNKNRMGKLFLFQIDHQTGEEISCGEVGGGFTDKDREDFVRAQYPLVVQVEFQKRFPSGALRHPQFLRLRTDKSPAECLLPTKGHS
ncbi:MAG: hypothetical protein AAB897_02585 [Patescibacteria group bacterium]